MIQAFESTLRCGEHAIEVFLDISGVFDTQIDSTTAKAGVLAVTSAMSTIPKSALEILCGIRHHIEVESEARVQLASYDSLTVNFLF